MVFINFGDDFMCGIVGHLGSSDSVQTVLEGLKRLEYRGYDSSGVSYLNKEGVLKTFKKKGKLAALVESLGDITHYNAFSCIGHTRWATHGQVNDTNAHPHTHGSTIHCP